MVFFSTKLLTNDVNSYNMIDVEVLVVYEILDRYYYPTITGAMMLISGLTSDHYYFLKIILTKLLTSNIEYCNIIITMDSQNWLSQYEFS